MIAEIRLQNFRSYSDNTFMFKPGVNIIVGPNTSGKTNLLEAILVVSSGQSYRAKDQQLISRNKEWSRIDCLLTDQTSRTVKLFIDITPNKKYEINKKPIKRLTITNTLPLVLFEPEHLLLLSGRPELRREYLDGLLEKTVIGYSKLRRQYKRAVSQRNVLLKNEHQKHKEIFPWNIRISELGGQIMRLRSNLVLHINDNLNVLYREISKSKTDVKFMYQSKWDSSSYESQLLKELESSISFDRVRGYTSAGPHREDVLATFDDKPSQNTASRGEIRTLILALKILELKIIEEARGVAPMLLLDDVFSELDAKRRKALTEHLSSYQSFITTTDADLVLQNFAKTNNIITLK